MSFIDIDVAKQHLRVTDMFSDDDIELKCLAAELAAIEYLQCNVYSTQIALDAAIAAVPATLSAAKAAYVIADAEADALDDYDLALDGKAHALSVYMRAIYAATRTRNGVVINNLILSAMLLTLGRLYEVREDGESLPRAAQDLLSPYRCYA